MTDIDPKSPKSGDINEVFAPTRINVMVNYGLYLLGFVLGGVSTIVGLVLAYINRGKADAVLASHYTYQIRTFWIGLLYGLIASLLTLLLIGFVLYFIIAIWVVIRCVKGLQAASDNKPIADPTTWLI